MTRLFITALLIVIALAKGDGSPPVLVPAHIESAGALATNVKMCRRHLRDSRELQWGDFFGATTTTTPSVNIICDILPSTGELFCIYDDFPYQSGLYTTIYFGCVDGGTLSQCRQCVIVQEDEPVDIDQTDSTCDSCNMCLPGSTYFMEFDCTNLVSFGVSRCDCYGNCS